LIDTARCCSRPALVTIRPMHVERSTTNGRRRSIAIERTTRSHDDQNDRQTRRRHHIGLVSCPFVRCRTTVGERADRIQRVRADRVSASREWLVRLSTIERVRPTLFTVLTFDGDRQRRVDQRPARSSAGSGQRVDQQQSHVDVNDDKKSVASTDNAKRRNETDARSTSMRFVRRTPSDHRLCAWPCEQRSSLLSSSWHDRTGDEQFV
jgi:hypothetical protein